jgi:hypothetical protein
MPVWVVFLKLIEIDRSIIPSIQCTFDHLPLSIAIENRAVIDWVSEQRFAKHSRSSLVSVGLGQDRVDGLDSNESSKKPLHYAPWNGTFHFWYKNRPLVSTSGGERRVVLVLATEGRGLCFVPRVVLTGFKGPVGRVLTTILEAGPKQDSDLRGSRREVDTIQGKRHPAMSTVLYNKKEKESLVSDVRSFLDPSTREWYAVRGILTGGATSCTDLPGLLHPEPRKHRRQQPGYLVRGAPAVLRGPFGGY